MIKKSFLYYIYTSQKYSLTPQQQNCTCKITYNICDEAAVDKQNQGSNEVDPPAVARTLEQKEN